MSIGQGARAWAAYPTLSAPLTMMGVERRWFLLSATIGMAMWNAINSILIGAVVFCILYGVGWWAWRVDPHMLTILQGKEPFWQQAYTNLVRWIIELYRILPPQDGSATAGWVTLRDVYHCAIDKALFAKKIKEAQTYADDMGDDWITIDAAAMRGDEAQTFALTALGFAPHPSRPDRRRARTNAAVLKHVPMSAGHVACPAPCPAPCHGTGQETGGALDRHLGCGESNGRPDREAVDRAARRRSGGRARGKLAQRFQAINGRSEPAERGQQAAIAVVYGVLHAGDLLTDVRVGLGLSGGVGGGGAVAVLGPGFQHGGGAVGGVCARADGDDVHGERPRAKRGPQRRVGHAPRAQLAIGGLPGIDVRERRRLIVDGDRQFEGKVSRDLRLPLRAVHPVWEVFPVDAERLEPLHLVGLGGEPSEGLPLDDVIEREQAPHEDVRRRILAPAVANVGDAKRPIDGLTGQEDGARAAGEDGPLVLGGELLLDEGADEAGQAFTVVAGKQVCAALRARKDTAVQGDKREPFRLAAGPSEGRELAGAVLERRDRDGARFDLGGGRRHPVTSARSPRK